MNKLLKNSRAGFTLIEMLISITIFTLFIGIVGGSYVTLVSANRDANETQKLYREVRFVFENVASTIRGGLIDFDCIDPEFNQADPRCISDASTSEKKTLSILSKDRLSRTLFTLREKSVSVAKETRATLNTVWNVETDWQPLMSTSFKVDELAFNIFPIKNPYETRNATLDDVQWQPSVHMVLKVKNYTFSDTYSSRNYGKQNLYK